jgi:hypothetical protein
MVVGLSSYRVVKKKGCWLSLSVFQLLNTANGYQADRKAPEVRNICRKKTNRLIAVRDKNSIRAKITFRTELNSPSKLILQKREKSFPEKKIALYLN